MARLRKKSTRTPNLALWAGLTLSEWRGAIRAYQRSGWYLFDGKGEPPDRASERHRCVLMVASILLPIEWHKAHAGRLSRDFYDRRRAWVNMWGGHVPRGGETG